MAVKTKYIIEGENRTEHLFNQLDRDVRAFDKRMSGIAAAGGAVGAALAVAFGGVKMVGVLREFGTLQASLETVTGSGKAAQEALGWIEPFAAQTPFQLEEVVSAFVKLQALGLKPSEAALRSYGNTASAMGKSLDQFIEAVADATTGEFERLKDFGITTRQQGDQVSLTFRGITKTIGKNAEEIEAYLRRIGDVDFAGASSRRAATLDGALSNLEDSVASLTRAMGDAGLTVVITDGAVAMSVLATNMATAVREGDGLLRVFTGLGSGIAELLRGSDMRALGEVELEIMEAEKRLADLENRTGRERFTGAATRAKRIEGIREELAELERLREGLRAVMNPEDYGAAPRTPPSSAPESPPPLSSNSAGGETGSKRLKQLEREGKRFEAFVRDNEKLQRNFARDWDKLMAEQAESAEALTQELRLSQESRLDDLERSLLTEREAIQANLADRLQLLRVAREQELRTTMEYAELEQRVREDAAREIAALEKRELDELAQSQEAQLERMTRAVQGWGDELTEAVLNFTTGAKVSFSDMVESMLRDIARLAIRQTITDPLGDLLSGALKGGGGGIGDFFGSLFGGGGGSGGFFDPSALGFATGARATGGPAFRGQPLIVGEQGRELFVPHNDGKVVPMERGETNIRIEVINNGPEQSVQAESGGVIDGEQRIRVIIGDMLEERLSSSGGARTMQNRFGVSPRTVNR